MIPTPTVSAQNCRVCGKSLPQRPLLHFDNMPCGAQCMPDPSNVHLDVGVTMDIFQCNFCGVVQMVGEPVPYYKEVIRASAFSEEMRQFRRGQFARFVEEFGLRGKRFLEVGCGRGEYLSIFLEAGLNAYGTEFGEEMACACREQGFQVETAFPDPSDMVLKHGPFDGFAALNFMEHWPDPASVLTCLRNNLAPGAIGLVEVPNFQMILRQGLFTEFIPDHIFYFDRETFENTLRMNGYEVLRCESIWYDYILSAVVRKRETVDIGAFISRKASLQEQLDAFIARHVDSGIAIWGAGHQALATIALLNIAHGVRYVIDSAPFKQGKLTPVTHLRIHAPEHLHRDSVGAIIVMAAAYSDEIVRMIQHSHGQRFVLAVLRESGLEVLSDD